MIDLNFTYTAYIDLVKCLMSNGYRIADYHSWESFEKVCILRHDVDFDLKKAAEFAEFETSISKDVHSTYFVLLSTDFYNLFTRENRLLLERIKNCGHEIGLHFDETQYDCYGDMHLLSQKIENEIEILSGIIAAPVTTVSMHRPSKAILDANLNLNFTINSYSQVFFQEFKYLSDSRMNWREEPYDCIQQKKYNRLHILTHPFWYEESEVTMKKKLSDFIETAKKERWQSLNQNFRQLEEILTI